MKLKLAYLLDRLFPNAFCWAKLVAWAYWSGSFREALKVQECKDDIHSKLEGCYCGKFMSERLKREITENEERERLMPEITKNIEEIAREEGALR